MARKKNGGLIEAIELSWARREADPASVMACDWSVARRIMGWAAEYRQTGNQEMLDRTAKALSGLDQSINEQFTAWAPTERQRKHAN